MSRRLSPRRTLRPYFYYAETEAPADTVVEETTTVVEPDRTLWPWLVLLLLVLLAIVGYLALRPDDSRAVVQPATTPVPAASPVVSLAPVPPPAAPPAQPPVVVVSPAQPPPPVIVQQPPAAPAPSPS